MALRIGLFLLLTAAMVSMADENSCLDTNTRTADESCRALAKIMTTEPEQLVSLGRKLEISGRFSGAMGVYRVALTQHPTNKSLQKGFIRVRSELKAQQLLSGLNPKPEPKKADTSKCWSTRWADALEACRQELNTDQNNPALYERLGDVLRGIGRPKAALKVYRQSLALQANDHVTRKYQTLSELVDLETSDTPLYVAANAVESKQSATPKNATASIPTPDPSTNDSVSRLELLADLKARGLINETEYATRRVAILDSSLGGKTKTTVPKINPPSLSPKGRYRALVIGNQKYKHFPRLESPVADATTISRLLETHYGFEVTTLTNVSRYESFDALAKLRRESRKEDSVMVYYAGHGYLDKTTSRGYWLPIDAEPENPANWISTSDISDLLAGISAHHVLVVADSCFSGSLIRSAGQVNLDERSELLERLYAKRSRTILTSGGLEPVLDSGSKRHSVFAFALIKALQENQGALEAGRLFVNIRDQVSAVAEQTPQYAPLRSAGHDGGDFIFMRRNTL